MVLKARIVCPVIQSILLLSYLDNGVNCLLSREHHQFPLPRQVIPVVHKIRLKQEDQDKLI